jgi:hypothetical protein
MQKITKQSNLFNDLINDLDEKMQAVLKRQEAEYLQGYTIYVAQRERELRDYIDKLNDRQAQSNIKDEIIQGLRKQITESHEINQLQKS